jgi:Carboxypeptidase regulatory-like domain
MTFKVFSISCITISALASAACNSAPAAKEFLAPATKVSMRLLCEEQKTTLECRAFADDVTTALGGGNDVTARVRWAADTHAVVVQDGNVRAGAGGMATVTASLIDVPGTPSASVMVVADAHSGDTRQLYVFEGEVRRFPSAEAIPGAQVSLISETGIARSVTTPSIGDAQGRFRFNAVAAGAYRLRAVSDGYRVNEMRVVVPGDMPRTITLLPEPRTRS